MTKAEELKILDKIAGLITESGKDSYISMTFAGIVDVCKRNITDDFGDSPVEDCANMRFALDAERVAHDNTKRLLAESQKMCKEAMEETIEWKNKYSDSVEHYEKIISENNGKIAELEKTVDDYDNIICDRDIDIENLKGEIIYLKAELYDYMRKE